MVLRCPIICWLVFKFEKYLGDFENMVNVAHIGLGKTATTTLQKHIFPVLANRLNYRYNDTRLKKLLIKSMCVPLSFSEALEIKETLREENHFISLESLVSWNPALWEKAANKNLKILGKDTKILITLRDPQSWLTSVYQQTVHEGNVVKPQRFFLPLEKYESASLFTSDVWLEYFCPDYLDFEKLIKIYEERFDFVECVNLDDIEKMNFLCGLFDIDESFRFHLSSVFNSAKRENRSYSAFAMSATFKREAFFKFFGAKSFGGADRRFEHMKLLWEQGKIANEQNSYKTLSLPQKALQFPKRALKRIIPTWMEFLQKYFDKIVPYRKYQLPPTVYLNEEKVEKSRNFLKNLSSERDGTEF